MDGQQTHSNGNNMWQEHRQQADQKLDKLSQQFPEIVQTLKQEFELIWGLVNQQSDEVSRLIQEQQDLQQLHNITQGRAQVLNQNIEKQTQKQRDNDINGIIQDQGNSTGQFSGVVNNSSTGINEDAQKMLQLPGDKLCILGGMSGDCWISKVNLYNVGENECCELPPLPQTSAQQPSTISVQQKVLVCGGNKQGVTSEVIQLDLEKGVWTQVYSMSCGRIGHCLQVVNGRAYAMGGKSNEEQILQTVEYWDMEKDLWLTTSTMQQHRYSFTALEYDGAIYAVGGFNGNEYLKSIERYDPREGKWQLCGEMQMARGSHVSGQYKGAIYNACGYDGGDFHTHAEFWDIRAAKVQKLPDCPILHAYSAGGVLNGKFCLYAGKHGGNNYNKSIAVLDLSCGGQKPFEWEVLGLQGEEEVTCRAYHSACIISSP